jgi:hypothetical protein
VPHRRQHDGVPGPHVLDTAHWDAQAHRARPLAKVESALGERLPVGPKRNEQRVDPGAPPEPADSGPDRAGAEDHDP